MAGTESAFHLAGHAVATSFSRYHVLAAPLKADSYGTGEITAALSRRKLRASQKVAEASARTDPEVAGGIALILCAGLASEQLAAAQGFDVSVEPARSAGDFEVARDELRLAGLSDDITPYVAAAEKLLGQRWAYVESVAKRLMLVSELHHSEVDTIIKETEMGI